MMNDTIEFESSGVEDTTTVNQTTASGTTPGGVVSTETTPTGSSVAETAGIVSGSLAVVVVVLIGILFCYYKRRRKRPRIPLPSKEACDVRHSVSDYIHRTSPRTDQAGWRGAHYGGPSGSNSDPDNGDEFYENTAQGSIPLGEKQTPQNSKLHSPNTSYPKSPDQALYVDLVADQIGEHYMNFESNRVNHRSPAQRQESETSMNYYNIPCGQSYQNVNLKLQK